MSVVLDCKGMGGGWVSRDGEGNGRMGFTGWGMVKGVGHGGGAMGWRGGGEVVIGGSSRRFQWKPKNKKSKKKAAAGKGGSRSLVLFIVKIFTFIKVLMAMVPLSP
jgi:hypothetical protein